MIRCSILKTNVTKEALVEDEYQKNQSAINSQNEDENGINSDLAKYKYKMRQSKANEETKKGKKNPKESEPTYQLQGQSERLQHWFDLDPYWIEDKFMTREPDF